MWIKTIILSNIFCSMEKHRQIKLQCLQKVQIWAFGFWYIKSTHYKRFLNWNQISPFAIDSFCTSHSICLSIGFRYGSFLWKWCVFNLSRCSSFLKKFSLSRKSVSKFKNRKRKTKTTLQSNFLWGTPPDDCFYRSSRSDVFLVKARISEGLAF